MERYCPPGTARFVPEVRILICLSSASRRREALLSKSLCLDRVARDCQELLNMLNIINLWLSKSYHMLACVGFMAEDPGENSGVRLRSTESQPTYSI